MVLLYETAHILKHTAMMHSEIYSKAKHVMTLETYLKNRVLLMCVGKPVVFSNIAILMIVK